MWNAFCAGPRFGRQLEHVREVRVAVVVDDRVAALPGGPRLLLDPDASGRCLVGPPFEVLAHLGRPCGHLGHERPHALVAARVRQALLSRDDQAIAAPAVGLEVEEEALNVRELVDLPGVHPRAVEEEDVAALHDSAHGLTSSRTRRSTSPRPASPTPSDGSSITTPPSS